MNDFSAGEAKTGEKQSRQSNSKYNFMQYVFFRKRYAQCTMGSGANLAPEAGEFSRIFVLNVPLQSVNLLITVSYRKNWGRRMY